MGGWGWTRFYENLIVHDLDCVLLSCLQALAKVWDWVLRELYSTPMGSWRGWSVYSICTVLCMMYETSRRAQVL